MQYLPPSSSGFETGREAQALLMAELAGGRTIFRRQRVVYPFHVTRPFYLDRMRPDLATLYLQSSSGGLYAGDRLKLDLVVGASAALNLTTQAATVVHHGRESGSVHQQSIKVGERAFCAVVSDPYVLFPHARLSIATTAEVARGSTLIIVDGFAMHDPHQRGEPFTQYSSSVRVMRPDGALLVSDQGSLQGDQADLRFGPLGGMRAAASVLIIAEPERRADRTKIENAVENSGCVVGTTLAPNGAGLAIRLLAPDGGTLGRGIAAAFHVAGNAALGITLAHHRK
jgi:urease accessory protein